MSMIYQSFLRNFYVLDLDKNLQLLHDFVNY